MRRYGSLRERLERLEELKNQIPFPLRPIALDLSDTASYETYAALLASEDPEITLLINCSGFGKFCATLDVPLSENLNMVDLNCKAVMAMCQHSIPYMPKGARIINIASVAAFQPIPYINVYGATKAFVLSYSRALNRELKSRDVTVTAVCPFWTKTEFFNRAIAKDKNAVVKKYVAMYVPEQIVKRAFRDAKKGRDNTRSSVRKDPDASCQNSAASLRHELLDAPTEAKLMNPLSLYRRCTLCPRRCAVIGKSHTASAQRGRRCVWQEQPCILGRALPFRQHRLRRRFFLRLWTALSVLSESKYRSPELRKRNRCGKALRNLSRACGKGSRQHQSCDSDTICSACHFSLGYGQKARACDSRCL